MSLAGKHADQVRDMWQSRALAAASGRMRAVLTVVLAKEYADDFRIIWRATFGMQDVPGSFISGYAKVMPSGRLVADVMCDGEKSVAAVYESREEFTFDMRRLADRMKLRDQERVEFMSLCSKWVVADLRVGINGERLVS